MANDKICANCSTPLRGPFCSHCGQQQTNIRRFFLTLINEAFEDIFKLNSRARNTLSSLLFKPGFLTTEYLKGRRASYIQPVRLYFFTSIIFFLVLSINNFLSDNPFSDLKTDSSTQLEQPIATPEATSGSANSASLEAAAKPAAGPSAEEPKTDQEIDAEIEDNVNINLPFTSKATNTKVTNLVRSQIKKAVTLAKQETGLVKSMLLELAPPVVFCLLPLFALLLKLSYVTRGIYFTEHLVYAIHCHAFIFLTLIIYTLIPNYFALLQTWVGGAILLWIPPYLWLSLKKVYQQGRFLTSLKFISLALLYTFMLFAGILFALLVGVMTL